MPRFIVAIVSVMAILISSACRLGAAEIEGVTFQDAHKIRGQRLVLNNVALMRYKIVIKAMVSALYLGEGVEPEDVLKDVPKRLEIHYFWDLEGKEITKAADKLLADNVSRAQLAKLQTEIKQMNSLFENVKAGDRYTMTYIPGLGTELSLNGKHKGVVPGTDFAAAYFTIWLGKKPMDVAMRDTLLEPH